tara:strand:- start:210 stop:338 length:129 start_codon:yes stop_codon:yes gene_type:complete
VRRQHTVPFLSSYLPIITIIIIIITITSTIVIIFLGRSNRDS